MLVAIERQRGEVGGLAEQDWSLRVTLVFMVAAMKLEIAHASQRPSATHHPLTFCPPAAPEGPLRNRWAT